MAGYTLGGGLGLLGRRYGFAADHLRRLRLVTADGRPHEIDADRAPELHWALRGAGRTGFGVVTELEFALFPLTRLYGGGIVWPAAAAADVLHAWREWAPTLPDEAGTSVALLRVPRDAGWPAPLHDRTVVHVRFTGADVDAVTGDALLAALRTVGTPLLDEVGELSLTATDAVHRDPAAPAPVHDGGAALRELPAAAVDALLAAADVDVASPLTTVELRALGGALGRAAAVPAAVAGRGAAYALHVQGRARRAGGRGRTRCGGDAARRGRAVVARRPRCRPSPVRANRLSCGRPATAPACACCGRPSTRKACSRPHPHPDCGPALGAAVRPATRRCRHTPAAPGALTPLRGCRTGCRGIAPVGRGVRVGPGV